MTTWAQYIVENDTPAEWCPKVAQVGQTRSWTVPSAAGGASDYDPAVDAFCAVVGIDPTALTPRERALWARQLEKLAGESNVGVLVEAIRAKPQSTISWKSWTTPYAVREDLQFLLLQVRSGGVKGKADGRTERNLEIIESWFEGA